MSDLRVICLGASAQDVFLRDKLFTGHKEGNSLYEEFALGSKNDIAEITFSTGGGATNAAVTFARHGFQSSYMGRIGSDVAGKAIIEALEHDGVDTHLLAYSDKFLTAYSVLLLAPSGERTILTYRGASSHFGFTAADFKEHTADWMYISSLDGDLETLKAAIHYAREHDIKVAINPGSKELAAKHDLLELLKHVAVLSVNKEEAQMLFSGDTSEDLVRKATQTVPVVIVTDGPKGSVASDGHKLYRAGMYQDVKVVDRTGAGDAFSSGFAAVMAAGGTIEQAMTFASANSTSVVQFIGAKEGILHSHSKLHDMPVIVTSLG